MGGLVFGAGFSISYFAIWWMGSWLMMSVSGPLKPLFTESERAPRTEATRSEPSESGIPFHELSVDEQIAHASVIALASFEPAEDGRMKAVIKEFLKKKPGTLIYYNIGDEYPSSSYFPTGDTRYGDGVVIFFADSPATMRMSMTYFGERVRGLGDMPVELLRKKAEEASE